MTTPISGKDGLVKSGGTQVASVRNWSLNLSSNNPEFATSDTPGHKVSVAGVKSGSVSFEAVLNVDAAQYASLKVGGLYQLSLNETATRTWTVSVRIGKMGESVDINEGGEVTLSYEGTISGVWTYPDGTLSSAGP